LKLDAFPEVVLKRIEGKSFPVDGINAVQRASDKNECRLGFAFVWTNFLQ
jgi:hypothetical protein